MHLMQDYRTDPCSGKHSNRNRQNNFIQTLIAIGLKNVVGINITIKISLFVCFILGSITGVLPHFLRHRHSPNFLTRLVQNLTLRNDCNLIPSAHETQRFCPLKTIIGHGWQSTAFAASGGFPAGFEPQTVGMEDGCPDQQTTGDPP